MDHHFATPTNETDFERFCRDFLAAHWPDSSPQRWGVSGQAQHGVDVIDMNAVEPLRGAQCKFKKAGMVLKPEEVEAEVGKARGFDLGGIKLGDYTILTTSERHTETQGKVIELNHQHRQKGLFLIRLLDWEMIEEILREHPGLWEKLMSKSLKALVEPIESSISSMTLVLRDGFEELRSSDSPAAIETRFDTVRNQLDTYRWQEAELLLRGLRQRQWHAMSEPQRFLVKSFQAQIEFAKGNWIEAGRHFLDAKQHLPDDQRAKFNYAVGLELIEKTKEACELARTLTLEFPGAAKPWAVICRTEAETMTAEELEDEIPTEAQVDNEVRIALAMRALRHEDWEAAARLSGAAFHQDAEWAAPVLILAQAKFQQAIQHAYKPALGPAVVEDGVLNEPLRLLDEAVAIAERTGHAYLLIQALLERARVRNLRGDENGADQDVQRAYLYRPQDPVVVARYGQWLFTHDQTDAAIPLLRKAVALEAGSDAFFLLAVALRSKGEAESPTEWVGLASKAAKDPTCSFRTHAVELTVDGLTGSQHYADAEALLNELAETGLSKCAVEAGRSRIAAARGDQEAATRHAAAAMEASREDTTWQDRRFLADTLVEIGEFELALPEWQAVAATSRQITDAWALVDVAKRVDRPDVILDVAREWRHAGIRDTRLCEEELGLLEQYQPHEAVNRIEEELRTRPDDPYLRLRLSLLGLKLNQPDLVCGDVERLPSYAEIGPRNGRAVVQILVLSEQLEEAVRYSYRLLRHHPRDPDARGLFVMLMLVKDEGMPKALKDQPTSAGPGVAFGYVEEGEDAPKWMVIEDETTGTGFEDEISVEHRLVSKVIGKRVGDSFLIPGMSGEGRKAKISDLATKYVHRLRETMDIWETRFAGHPGFEKVHLAEGDGDGTIPDLTPILRKMHERKRHVDALLADYRTKPIPLHILAEGLGIPFFDTVTSLAGRDQCFIRCCPGEWPAFEEATTYARAATTWIIDSSTIATLDLLELEEHLERWPVELVVSTSTMTHLEDYQRTLRASRGDGQVMTTDTGVGLRFVETEPEVVTARLQRFERLIEYLRQHTAVRDAGELAALPTEIRDSLVNLLGLHGAESVVLAARPGHVLWSDDGALARIAQHYLPGTRRVWTQAVLADVAGRGLLTEGELATAVAKLVGFRYGAVHFDIAILLSACQLAEWRPAAWPLKQALDALLEEHDTAAKWQVTATFFRTLFLQPITYPGHETVALTVLDRLAGGPGGVTKVKKLCRLLPTLFGLHVTAEQAACNLIVSWLAVRGEQS